MASSCLYVHGNVNFAASPSAVEDPDALALDWPARWPDFPAGKHVRSVACGGQHCLAVIDDKLYGFGSNGARQIHPLALDVCDALTPINLPVSSPPVAVACGALHSLVLCADGSVLSAGDNSYDQLGHVTKSATPVWNRVALPVKAQGIAAAGHASFVVADGALYSWGRQEFGHLAHGTTGAFEMVESGKQRYATVELPAKVAWFQNQRLKVDDVSVSHNLLVARCGEELYSVGSNAYGKLGLGLGAADTTLPKRVDLSVGEGPAERLVSYCVGNEHVVVIKSLPNNKRVMYQWGKVDRNDASSVPQKIIFNVPDELCSVVGGDGFTVGLCTDGTIVTWGFQTTNFRTATVMQYNTVPSRKYPYPVECLEGKYVTGAAIAKSFVVLIADDTKFVAGTDPTTATVDVVVPVALRYKALTARLTADRFETAVMQWYTRVLGSEAQALARFQQIPAAPPMPPVKKIDLKKRGARNLNVGSKVRVWMSDVYALGVVAGKDDDNANAFEVRWAREDWDPEVVELRSDDETLDEENDNRWQNLWFVPETPAAA